MTASPAYPRPAAGEHAAYYTRYIEQVPHEDLLTVLRRQAAEYDALFDLPEPKGDSAYAPGKWSIKQVLGHVIDAERVFSYRALVFGRNDPGPLPAFDENAWMAPAGFSQRTLADLREEFRAVRQATVSLLAHFPAEAAARVGTASGNPVSVRALGYIIAGHAIHHAKVVKDRYL
jgi:DinB family protein